MAVNKKKLIAILGCAAFAASAVGIGVVCYVTNQQADPITAQRQDVNDAEQVQKPTSATAEITPTEPPKEISERAKVHLQQNADTVGWIYIPDTKVDYPIVQSEDNAYYLDIGFDLEPNRAGAIFMDYRNVFGSDISAQSDNIVIYGHNMANNTMFGSLRKYRQDYSYYKTHQYIELSSNYDDFTYVIFGLVITSGSPSADWRYWDMEEFASKQEFDDYVKTVQQKNLVDIDMDVQYGDQLLTLSTCYSDADDSRFLIIARKLREGETVENTADHS